MHLLDFIHKGEILISQQVWLCDQIVGASSYQEAA